MAQITSKVQLCPQDSKVPCISPVVFALAWPVLEGWLGGAILQVHVGDGRFLPIGRPYEYSGQLLGDFLDFDFQRMGLPRDYLSTAIEHLTD